MLGAKLGKVKKMQIGHKRMPDSGEGELVDVRFIFDETKLTPEEKMGFSGAAGETFSDTLKEYLQSKGINATGGTHGKCITTQTTAGGLEMNKGEYQVIFVMPGAEHQKMINHQKKINSELKATQLR